MKGLILSIDCGLFSQSRKMIKLGHCRRHATAVPPNKNRPRRMHHLIPLIRSDSASITAARYLRLGSAPKATSWRLWNVRHRLFLLVNTCQHVGSETETLIIIRHPPASHKTPSGSAKAQTKYSAMPQYLLCDNERPPGTRMYVH